MCFDYFWWRYTNSNSYTLSEEIEESKSAPRREIDIIIHIIVGIILKDSHASLIYTGLATCSSLSVVKVINDMLSF